MVRRQLISAALLLAVLGAAHAQAAPVRRALLIGINKYKSDSVPNLNGAVNDILRMEGILKSRYGFTHIRKVTDGDASRAGILAALERIVDEARPGDIVYLHYSGHGSQVKDYGGDEKRENAGDLLDETLVPADGRTPGVPDVTDDEIAKIFDGFKTNNVVIVFDSCHSGTATRSVDVRSRRVPADTRDLYPKTTDRAIVPIYSRFVAFTGAASNQQALDGPCDGAYHGLFTYSLSRSLATAAPDASLRDIMKGIEKQLQRLKVQLSQSHMPEPQLEADKARLDQPLFQSRSASSTPVSSGETARPWVEVKRVKGKPTVLLVGGVPMGAAPGSVWAIYPPGEKNFRSSKRVPHAKVTETVDANAVATLIPESALVLSGCRAVLLAPPRSVSRVTVRLVDVPDDQRVKLLAALTRIAGHIEIVGQDKPSGFVVDQRDGEWVISGRTGTGKVTSFRELDPDLAASRMAIVMTRSQAASELMALENPNSAMRLDVRLSGTGSGGLQQALGTRGIRVQPDLQSTAYRARRQGEPRNEQNCLMVELSVSRDAYVTIVGVDAVGEVELLFPNSYQKQTFYPQGYVRAGQQIRIPDSRQSGNQAGFHWDLVPPLGTTTLRVFASTDLETAKMVRDYVTQAATKVRAIGGAGGDPTQALMGLAELREKLISRAVHVVPDSAVPQPYQPPQPKPYQPPQPPPPQPPQPQQYQPQAPPPANDWTAVTVTFQLQG